MDNRPEPAVYETDTNIEAFLESDDFSRLVDEYERLSPLGMSKEFHAVLLSNGIRSGRLILRDGNMEKNHEFQRSGAADALESRKALASNSAKA